MDALPYYQWKWRDYRANRRVQRMPWQAKGLYRELLDEFWAEGSLPTDHAALADVCGCTLAEFDEFWPSFQACWYEQNGRLYNAKMDEQRTAKDAERVAKAEAGRSGGLVSNSSTREASAKQVQASVKELQAQPDIAEQSRAKAEHTQKQSKASSRGKRESNPMHEEVKSMVFAYYRLMNEGMDPPWDGAEGKQLGMLLKAQPTADLQHWRKCLGGRHRSDVNHAERPSLWLRNLGSYANALNAFKQPKENADGTTRQNGFQTRDERNLEAYRRSLEPARGGDQDADFAFGHGSAGGRTGIDTPRLLEGA